MRFKKGYEISLNRVHDTIKIKENGETLTLTVNADPMRMVSGLNKAQEKLKALVTVEDGGGEPSENEIKETAEYFAAVIFGAEQARALMDFYANDAGCIINVCGKYFRERLGAKISAVQKRAQTAKK